MQVFGFGERLFEIGLLPLVLLPALATGLIRRLHQDDVRVVFDCRTVLASNGPGIRLGSTVTEEAGRNFTVGDGLVLDLDRLVLWRYRFGSRYLSCEGLVNVVEILLVQLLVKLHALAALSSAWSRVSGVRVASDLNSITR